MRRYHKKLNKWGVTLSLPYLLIMAINFDMLFFGAKYLSQYTEEFKQPILYQIKLLDLIGIDMFLNRFLSFFQKYILITSFVTISLYNFGRLVERLFFQK